MIGLLNCPITNYPITNNIVGRILGDPRAVSGGGKESKPARKNSGEEKSTTRRIQKNGDFLFEISLFVLEILAFSIMQITI